MNISESTRQAYTEINSFIELLNEYNKNKIPVKLREFFKEEQDKNYVKIIDSNISIKEQNIKRETLALIAFLNLKYWCEDDKEKNRLKNIYVENEKIYKTKLNEKYNYEKLFENKKKNFNNSKDNIVENELVVKKETMITKFINKIKSFFKIKNR